MWISEVRVRCTGHLSAISISRFALLGVERAFHGNDPIDLIEHPGFGFAFGAILRVDLAVLQRHRDALQRQRFAVGIQAHGHRGAGAEAGQHKS
jgi:hypothetical protein